MTWFIHRRSTLVLGGLVLLLAGGCSTFGTGRKPTRSTSNAFDYLYPKGISEAVPASEVELRLPLRVGLAFAPAAGVDPIPEQQKQALLAEVAAAFKSHSGIGHLELIPSLYLKAFGGFTNVDEIAKTLGFDLIALISYNQNQFTESTRASWTYLTVVGPLLIQGEKNETYTVVDAVVYDIKSRTLLFRAGGDSVLKGSSSPLNFKGKNRRFSAEGFNQAIPVLIGNLNTALTEFEKQAESGTVRGPGTPAVALYDATGKRLNQPAKSSGGGGGAGAFGGFEALLLAGLGAAAWKSRRRAA
jgi:rhombotail lipoprotein